MTIDIAAVTDNVRRELAYITKHLTDSQGKSLYERYMVTRADDEYIGDTVRDMLSSLVARYRDTLSAEEATITLRDADAHRRYDEDVLRRNIASYLKYSTVAKIVGDMGLTDTGRYGERAAMADRDIRLHIHDKQEPDEI